MGMHGILQGAKTATVVGARAALVVGATLVAYGAVKSIKEQFIPSKDVTVEVIETGECDTQVVIEP